MPNFTDLERRPVTVLGGVDGLVTLAEGQRLRSYAARANALGATAELIDHGNAVEVPALGAIEVRCDEWNASVRFTGTSGYMVEIEG